MEPYEVASAHEVFQGDVVNLDEVRGALEGMEAVIINHMAPRSPNAYDIPERCFDINVKGTANLFFAAEAAGVKRIVLISTTGQIDPPSDINAWLEHVPQRSELLSLYNVTKSCQEAIAEQYARLADMSVSILRVGYILDGDAMRDKYGREIGERATLDTDRRDVGEVARLCLERQKPGLAVFPVMSTHEAMQEWGVQRTVDELGWQPRYDFERLPLPKAKETAV